MPLASRPKLYNPRHTERTLLYQTIVEHYATWLELASAGQFDGQGDYRTPKPYVRKAFGKYLECGIFAHGFARARCAWSWNSISPARGPPLWDAGAQVGEDDHAEPDWNLVGQAAPDYEVDQRVSW